MILHGCESIRIQLNNSDCRQQKRPLHRCSGLLF